MITEPEMQAEVQRLKKRVDRERRARLEAETLAERETRTLYDRQQELELLMSITDVANGATSVPDVIQETLHAICAYLHWPVGHAYIVDASGELLESSKIWHLDHPEKFQVFREVSEAKKFSAGEGLPGSVWQGRGPVWIPDVKASSNFPRAQGPADIGVVAAFAFPVMAGETVMAVLEFFSDVRVEETKAWLKISAQAGIQLGRIFERQRSSSDLEKASRELLELSRRAGMAEVATGVLHNVGNVLNSVSVSSTLIGDRLRKSKATNLRLATAMLKEKNGNLAEFLTTDPKGKLLPDYMDKAAEQLEKERAEMIAEAESLHENIEHIKGIVAMQQDYAKVSGLAEQLDPAALVNDALRMKAGTMSRQQIQVVTEFAENLPRVGVDRHQVMQILINLLRNAKQAVETRAAERLITVRVGRHDGKQVAIAITDNGVGVAAENLTRIFNYGFTTKPTGHGFGLHSGANAAKEMGGRITVESEGEGHGATFTLYLPVSDAKREGP